MKNSVVYSVPFTCLKFYPNAKNTREENGFARICTLVKYLGPNIFDVLRNTRNVLGAYRANFSDPSSVETRTSPTWTGSRESLRLSVKL